MIQSTTYTTETRAKKKKIIKTYNNPFLSLFRALTHTQICMND